MELSYRTTGAKNTFWSGYTQTGNRKGVFMCHISVSRHSEYCIFKVSNSPFWQANFWDFEKRAWACRRSTGVLLEKPKAQAEKIARQLLTAGVLTSADGPDVGFIDYLNGFWQDDGEYVRRAKEVKEKPISARYVKNCQGDIRLHLSPYTPFKKIRISEITTGHIERWELWAKETHGISGSRVNACLKLIKVALGQAAKLGYISKNPALGVDKAAYAQKVKGILSQAEAAAVCALPLDNPRRQLAVLMGLCCGMRRGEIRGLQWGDIQDGLDFTPIGRHR
jgi:hypothetical protein